MCGLASKRHEIFRTSFCLRIASSTMLTGRRGSLVATGSSSLLVPFAVVTLTVLGMECLAWASREYVMHGFGWGWHRDHHEPHDGFFRRTIAMRWSARA